MRHGVVGIERGLVGTEPEFAVAHNDGAQSDEQESKSK